MIIALLVASWVVQSGIFVKERTPGAVLLLLALIGALPAVWHFFTIRGAIADVYGASLGWGWGLIVFVIGWAMVGWSAVTSFVPTGISS